jgi:3'(2'), 5'-bisphosphate nucleotidase
VGAEARSALDGPGARDSGVGIVNTHSGQGRRPDGRLSAPATRARDHHAARDVADAAARLLLEIRAQLGGGVPAEEVRRQGDAESHALIRSLLGRAFTGDAIFSEEGDDTRGIPDSERVWIVDPLDGTREFGELERDDWAVHVALTEQGRLVAGAVALPARGVTYATDAAPLSPAPPPRPPRVAVSRTRPAAEAELLAARLDGELVPMGSAGAKAMAVVDGVVDVYLHSGGQYVWDSAAPVAVALAAGLHASRLDGTPLAYDESEWLPDLVICRPELRDEVLAVLAA